MRLGIDFDGVISDNNKEKIEYVKKYHNKTISQEETQKRILGKIIGDEEYEKMCEIIYNSEITLQLPIVKDAKESLQELIKEHEIYIITKRTKEESLFAKKWLEEQKIPFTKIIHEEVADASKEVACLTNNITIMLEDRYDQLERFNQHKVKLFLLNRPDNQDIQIKEDITRTSWKEFTQIVKSLKDHSN